MSRLDVFIAEFPAISGLNSRVRMVDDQVMVWPLLFGMTDGGLVLPDVQADKGPITGVVIAAGPGRWESGGRKPMDVEVGDVVTFQRLIGTAISRVSVDGDDVYICSERDLLYIESPDRMLNGLRALQVKTRRSTS